ncbi:hypothetical protein TSUD_293470 [Trifolium subterraneum]|uniref:Transposase (putative) gypsy type domain-containing protein n=1 Tax=Trifolium subterraneum TaxID=3900 RepID=A0A2Z6MYW0_TRISU|nr:hypothetical protein TSUD_293470 [Trifolium subterraneum]
MADIEEPVESHRLVDTITDERLAWVAPEPRGAASSIVQGDSSVHTIVEDRGEGDPENWEVHVPEEGKRVCSEFSEGGFAMYEFAFKDLGFRLPFSDFAVGVFDRLRLAPSQLHPNSLAFIRAFEQLCDYLDVEPTLPLFFRIFKIQRQTFRGRQGWVSLKQHQLGNTVTDLQGKQENYANLAADLRKVEKEVAELKITNAAERKGREKAEDELESLRQMMTSSEDEPEHVRGLVTRAELVGEIRAQMGKVFESAKYSFNNAVAQLKIVNPGLVTEGTGMLRKVENGEIVIPDKYKQMEQEEEEEEAEEDQEEDMPDVGEEEGQGESDH